MTGDPARVDGEVPEYHFGVGRVEMLNAALHEKLHGEILEGVRNIADIR